MIADILDSGFKVKSTCQLLKILTTLCWLSCGSSFVIKPASFPPGQNWTQFGGGPQRTHRYTATLRPPLKNIWVYKASSAVGPTLLVVDSLLYFATLDGKLELLDIRTGDKIAREKTQGAFTATCAFYENSLIIASRYGDETLALVDLTTGKHRWRVNAGDIAGEPLIAEGAIYVSALYKHIDKYDLNTGEKIWTFKTEGQLRSSPSLSNEIVVSGCDDGTLYALSAETGKLKWQFKTRASVFATPAISDDTVLVGSLDSLFYAIDLDRGDLIWTFHALRPIFQSAATDGKYVVFGTSGGLLYCLEVVNGREMWRFQAKSAISTAPLISGSVVYFGSLDKHYYCLDLQNGKELWRFETRGRIRTSPVVWGNYLFGASEDRYLYGFVQSDSLMAESLP